MSADRVLPANVEAERAVIGGVFIRPATFDQVGDLQVNEFFLPAHQLAWEAMRDLHGKGVVLDPLTVGDEMGRRGDLVKLEGGQQYLIGCMDAVPTAENVVHHAAIVQRCAAQRRLISVCRQIESEAYGDFHDLAAFLAEAREKVASVDLSTQKGPEKIGVGMDDLLSSIEKRSQNPDGYFIRTGIDVFDREFNGLQGGNLIVVAARPGMGKSAFTLGVMLNAAAAGVPCLMFSMEMTKREIRERAISMRARVNGRRVASGQMAGPEWMRVVKTADKELPPLPLWLDDRHLTAARICAEARRWFAKLRWPEGTHEEQKQAVIAVDYLGLIESSHQEPTREREVAEASRQLKKLAQELKCPVIEVCQLNRLSDKEARKPKLSDLRESGAIEQDANVVIFPYWEGRAPNEGKHDAMLIVAKNRSNAQGIVHLDWEAEFTSFGSPVQGDERLPYVD